jgi:[ribosomal protein S5]-alanine N-acetyltransferase
MFGQPKGLNSLPVLADATIYLRAPNLEDYPAWAKLRSDSKEHLVPYEPRWQSDELSRLHYRELIMLYHKRANDDHTYPFFIFTTQDHSLLGGITLFNIRRGIAQMATLGYWIGATYVGQGLMTRALQLIMNHGFDTLHLHRLEAACVPRNTPSKKLLQRAGFHEEGIAKSYLQINGQWEDHILFAKLNDQKT